jgi:hypothetical protein
MLIRDQPRIGFAARRHVVGEWISLESGRDLDLPGKPSRHENRCAYRRDDGTGVRCLPQKLTSRDFHRFHEAPPFRTARVESACGNPQSENSVHPRQIP